VNKYKVKCTLLCSTLDAVLFTTLITNICTKMENLRLCTSAEAGIVLNLFLNLYKNEPRVLVKLFLHKEYVAYLSRKVCY